MLANNFEHDNKESLLKYCNLIAICEKLNSMEFEFRPLEQNATGCEVIERKREIKIEKEKERDNNIKLTHFFILGDSDAIRCHHCIENQA